VLGLYCRGFMRQLREFDRELAEARRNGRLLGRLQLSEVAAAHAAAQAMAAATVSLLPS